MQTILKEQEACNLSSAYHMFKYSIRCELTRKYYERLRRFFDFIEFFNDKDIEERCNSFAEKGRNITNWALNHILSFMQYQKERVEKNEIAAATLGIFVKSIKLFCEMSDISIPWKKITRGLPRPRLAANDRAPSIEEIRKLVQYPDRRIKPIVCTMISSGIRIGAWDLLRWKHVVPILSDDGKIIAAKIVVYAGDVE